jgi:hypothetical protein
MVMIGAGLAGGEGGLAAEPAAATGGTATNAVGTGAPPAGVRIAIDGNSWSVWGGLLLPLAKEVGIQGQVDVSKAGKQRLETGEVDVWTYGTHQPKDSYVAKIVEQGLKSNANFRFFYQAAWPIGDARWMNKGDEIKTKDDYDTTKIDYLQKYTDEIRKAREAFADGVNQPLGKRAVFIVPFGDAIVKLRALIVADKFPGVKRQSELFPDMMPHPGVLLASLSAYCHFAAIYRIPPPAGVPPPDSADQAAKDGYAQQAILRQIAWETVSKYSYAGVAATVKNPGRPEEAKNTRMLFLGNSITLHPPAEGMSGSWGMAASSAEKDYVHLVLNALEKRNGNKPESKVLNLADFERGFEQYDIAAKLKAEIEFQADTVILAIGENVPDLRTDEAKLKFRDSVSRLLRLLKADRRCAIYVRSCFWPNAAKDSALKEACAAMGGVFVDISALSKDERNYARSERKFANTGIAIHPGDKGMSAIADLIFAAIKEHDLAKTESKPAPAAVQEAVK